MPSIEQKDPSTPSGSAGGPSPTGSSSGLSRNEKLTIIGLAVVVILFLIFFKR
jgi:hypothetical protein